MSMRLYLAMTAAEYHSATPLPEAVAWMACHFSCYGAGLCNLPDTLPPKSMLIVNDRTPPHHHDPQQIAQQLDALCCRLDPACVLLDFQRPDIPETAAIAQEIIHTLPCPVGVTEPYAVDSATPVFLSPPLHLCLEEYLAPWKGREIWLEAAVDTANITLTTEGAQITPSADPAENLNFTDWQLHCRYQLELQENAAVFTLHRDSEQLHTMLAEAEKFGVTQAVGLYQQLG